MVHAAKGKNSEQEAEKLCVLRAEIFEWNFVYSLKLVVECRNMDDAGEASGAGEGVEAQSSSHVLRR